MKRITLAAIMGAATLAVAACDRDSRDPLSVGRGPSFSTLVATPQLVSGNPTCQDLGYAFGFKIDMPASGNINGTYTVAANNVTIGTVTVSTTDQKTWSWTSSFGIDAAVSKGGNSANVYRYSPEATHDEGLVSPLNNGGQVPTISHVDFCFDFELGVAKTASTRFDRLFSWQIAKHADQTSLSLAKDEQFTVNYTVDVALSGQTDRDWGVSGTVTITNPAPVAVSLTGIGDTLSGIGPVTLDCGGATSVGAGQTLTCTYDTGLPDGTNRTNRAGVTTSGATFSLDVSGTASNGAPTSLKGSGSVAGGAAQAAVTFGDPTTLTDESVNVTDSQQGSLGSVGISQSPRTFTYSRTVSYSTCGSFQLPNTASFTTNDQGLTGSASVTIPVTVTGCTTSACTLTQGYWKTHSSYGPARPADATWLLLANGPDTPFFLSGASFYRVLWTAPQGNAYYILADQWIAARLNQLHGSDLSAVQSAFSSAATFLTTYTPSQVGSNRTLKSVATTLAGTLDQYNSGLIGPGHCSE